MRILRRFFVMVSFMRCAFECLPWSKWQMDAQADCRNSANQLLLNLFLLYTFQTVSSLFNLCPSRKRLVYGLPYCLLACLAACQVLFAIVRALT